MAAKPWWLNYDDLNWQLPQVRPPLCYHHTKGTTAVISCFPTCLIPRQVLSRLVRRTLLNFVAQHRANPCDQVVACQYV